MKFLVTGSFGLVGTQITKDLVEQNHTVFSCYYKEKPAYGIPILLDLADKNKIIQTILETNPDRIIHLAAITDVDLCEEDKELAFLINAKATEILAKQAAKIGAFFLYVSTDYVFDGNDKLKKENNPTNPLGYYGQSKLEGEFALNNLASSWCIARTSTPFGLHKTKKSFPIWVKENLESNKEIPVLVDQFTSPTYVPNLSKMLIEITLRQITGVIHVAGATRISRYEFAELLSQKLELNKTLLKPITSNEINWKAKRPLDSSLDISLATEILREKPQTLEQSLDHFIKDLKSK